jgi:hypothetical protein
MVAHLLLETVCRLDSLANAGQQRKPILLSLARYDRSKTESSIRSASAYDRDPTAVGREAIGLSPFGHRKDTLIIIIFYARFGAWLGKPFH